MLTPSPRRPAVEELAVPVQEARDVVESYRVATVWLADWSATLSRATGALDRCPVPILQGVRLDELAGRLSAIVDTGLDRAPATLLDDAGHDLERLVEVTRASGVPAPEEEDWSF